MTQSVQTHNNLVKALLIGGLTAILAFVIGYIVYSYATKPPQSNTTSTLVDNNIPVVSRGEMHLDPDTLSVLSDETFTVDVIIDAKGAVINGSDSVITYDPTYIRVLDIQGPSEPTDDFMLMRDLIENDRIILSLLRTNYTDVPTEKMTIATLTLRQLKPGTTTLSIDHMPGTTEGSTIIDAQTSENILDVVSGSTVTLLEQ